MVDKLHLNLLHRKSWKLKRVENTDLQYIGYLFIFTHAFDDITTFDILQCGFRRYDNQGPENMQNA